MDVKGIVAIFLFLTLSFAGKYALSCDDLDFVARCVRDFENDSSHMDYYQYFDIDGLDMIRCVGTNGPIVENAVAIFDPLRICALLCPNCGKVLEYDPNRKFSGRKSHTGYGTRLIYGLDERYTIVTQVYLCLQSGDKVWGTDPAILQQCSKEISLPFILTSRSGVSQQLLTFLMSSLQHGLSIKATRSIIVEQYQCRFITRKKQFFLKVGHEKTHEMTFPSFDPKTAPGRQILKIIFLAEINANKDLMEKKRLSIEAEYLTCDHTFHCATKIGYFSAKTKKFVKQYTNLFIIMNEIGNVLEYRFTASTKFAHIRKHFEAIRDRMSKPLKLVIIDCCCAWKYMLRDVLGQELQVKLDVFHAVKRFTCTIPKSCPVRKMLTKEFSMVFRRASDSGKVRTKLTPDKKELSKNWERFYRNWHGIVQNEKSVLNEKSIRALKNIKYHIDQGCLSEIPPGAGTNRNERLHATLNAHGIFRARTVGVQLANASLAHSFHAVNTKTSSNDCVFAPPFVAQKMEGWTWSRNDGHQEDVEISAPVARNTQGLTSTPEASTSSARSSNGWLPMLSEEQLIARGEDLVRNSNERRNHGNHSYSNLKDDNTIGMKDSVTISNAIAKTKALKYLRGKSGDSPLLYEPKLFFGKLDRSLEGTTHEITAQAWGFMRVPALADGNCLFHSVVISLKHQLATLTGTDLYQRLNDIGINPEHTSEEVMIERLRGLVAQEFIDHLENYYEPVVASGGDYFEMVNQFRISGTYDLPIGDAALLALSNVLQAPITVFSTINSSPLIITPSNGTSHTDPSIFLMHNHSLSHFDAAIPNDINVTNTSTTNSTQMKIQPDTREKHPIVRSAPVERSVTDGTCRCGINDKNVKERCNSFRCLCFKSDRSCTHTCGCIGCTNGKPVDSGKKRGKKRKHVHQIVTKSSLEYITDSPEKPRRAGLCDFEKCLLFEIMQHNELDISARTLMTLYNNLVNNLGEAGTEAKLEQLSLQQVAAFLSRVKSEREIVMLQ